MNSNIKSLFDFIPFNEQNIKKFIENYDQDFRYKYLGKEQFYIKNEHDRTFIDTLINLGPSKSLKESDIRVHLLYTFFEYLFKENIFSLDDNKQHKSDQILVIFEEALSKKLQEEYENIFKNPSIVPKFTIDEYLQKITLELEKNIDQGKKINNIKEILKVYFTEIDNSQYSNKKIGSAFLLSKMMKGSLFADTNMSKIMSANMIKELFGLSMIPKELIIEVASGYSMMVLMTNKLNIDKDKKDVKPRFDSYMLPITLDILETIIQDALINNKIMTNYEEFNAELNSNDKIKTKKPKI